MGRLDGRVAVVTGAGQGVGRGVARRYAREGAAVVVADINVETGAAVAAEITGELGGRAIFVPTDILQQDQVEAMVQRAVDELGTVHILVNNAYVAGGFGRFEHKPDGDLELAFRGGPLHTWWAMRATFPHMKAQQWGRIINLVSLNGINAHKYSADYNAAKEAIRAITRTAAVEWGRVRDRCAGECRGDAEVQPTRAHGRSRARHRRGRALPRERGQRLRHRQHDLRERWHPGERGPVGSPDAGVSELRLSQRPSISQFRGAVSEPW